VKNWQNTIDSEEKLGIISLKTVNKWLTELKKVPNV
jgi:hypothetical protein